MMIRICVRVFLTALCLTFVGATRPAAAYVCETFDRENCIRWLTAVATIRPFLGGQFDEPVFLAGADWTAINAGFRFNVVAGGVFNDPCTTPGPCEQTGATGDNPVFFTSDVCGRNFAGDIIAQTITCYRLDNGGIINAPMFFNSRINWDIYDGSLIPGVTDIRRVILHELGHVAGLNHPDDAGQNVIAVMNGRVSSIDRLQADDVAGMSYIYGGGPPPPAGGGVSGGGCTLMPGAKSSPFAVLSWMSLPLVLLMRRRTF